MGEPPQCAVVWFECLNLVDFECNFSTAYRDLDRFGSVSPGTSSFT